MSLTRARSWHCYICSYAMRLLVACAFGFFSCIAALPTARYPGTLRIAGATETEGFNALERFAVIDGDLSINTAREHISLMGLREVRGDLSIRTNSARDINLQRLEIVTGDLIVHAPKSERLFLTSLRSVGGSLKIVSGKPAKTPVLKTVGHNIRLRAQSGMIQLNRLQSVGGGIDFSDSGIEAISFETLYSIGNPTPTAAPSTHAHALQPMRIVNNPQLKRVHLPTLKHSGPIRISHNPRLAGIDFRKLTTVQGQLYIVDNPQLTVLNIQEVQQLGAVGAISALSYLALHSLHFPERIIWEGDLHINNNPKLQRILLGALRLGHLRINDVPKLQALMAPYLEQLRSFKVLNAPRLRELRLPSLLSIEGNLKLGSVPAPLSALFRLKLGTLQKVKGIFQLLGTALTTLKLPELKNVGSLTIQGNQQLRGLSLSPALSVHQNVTIQLNALPLCLTTVLKEQFGHDSSSLPRVVVVAADHRNCLAAAVNVDALKTMVRPRLHQCLAPHLSPGPMMGGLILNFQVNKQGRVDAIQIPEPAFLAATNAGACLNAFLQDKSIMYEHFLPIWKAHDRSVTTTFQHGFALIVRKPWQAGDNLGPAQILSILGTAPWRHRSAISSLAFLANNRLISGDTSGEIRLWSTRSGREYAGTPQHSAIKTIAVSPSENLVAIGYKHSVAVLNVSTLKTTALPWTKETPEISALSFADENSLWIGDKAGGLTRFPLPNAPGHYAQTASVAALAPIVRIANTNGVNTIAWAADGSFFAAKSGARRAPMADAQSLLPEVSDAVFLNRKRGWVLSGYGEQVSALWKPQHGAAVPLSIENGVLTMTRINEGREVAFASGDEVHFLSTQTWQPSRPALRSRHSIRALESTRDGQQFAIGDQDGNVDLFSIDSTRSLRGEQGHTAPVIALTAYDGTLVSLDEGGRALEWKAPSAEQPRAARRLPEALGASSETFSFIAQHKMQRALLRNYAERCSVKVTQDTKQWETTLRFPCTAARWLPKAVLCVADAGGTLTFFGGTGVITYAIQGVGVINDIRYADGNLLVARNDRVELWALNGKSLLATLHEGASRVAFTRHGPAAVYVDAETTEIVLIRGRRLEVWKMNGRSYERVLGHHERDITDVASNGGKLLSASVDGTVHFYDVERGVHLGFDLMPGGRYPTSVTWLNAGKRFAVGTDSGEIFILKINMRTARPNGY